MASLTDHIARRALLARGFHSQRILTSAGWSHVLHAEGEGQLPPVVLLHGFGASGTQMVPLLLRLRRYVRRLVVPDLPAHGFSDVPTGGVTKVNLQSGLFETLNQVIREPVVLFGNSMGGMAAIRYAASCIMPVRAMILCSPGGAAMSPAELDAFQRSFRLRRHKDAVKFVDRLLNKKKSPLRHVFALSVRRRLGRTELQRLMRSATPEDLLQSDELRALTMPILMVWGQADEILPRESRDFFVRHLPDHARILEPENLGHSPYLESARDLTRYVVEFLSEVDGGPSRETA